MEFVIGLKCIQWNFKHNFRYMEWYQPSTASGIWNGIKDTIGGAINGAKDPEKPLTELKVSLISTKIAHSTTSLQGQWITEPNGLAER